MKKVLFSVFVFSFFIFTQVNAAGEHDYFNALIARPDFWKGYSLRPVAGAPITSPYYEKQLWSDNSGGYGSGATGNPWMSYNPSIDTDPHRQDATKILIPAFKDSGATLTSNIGTTETLIIPSTYSTAWNVTPQDSETGRAMRIDNEIMLVQSGNRTTGTVTVVRGKYGTVAAPHSAGAKIYMNTNSVPTTVRLPLDTVDNHTYLFTWDGYWTDSYVNTGLKNHKTFNFISSGIWLEPNTQFSGSGAPGFNKLTDVASFSTRSYNRPGTESNWLLTDGNYRGPNAGAGDHLPESNQFIFKPNTWVRFWYLIEQRANDFDLVSAWLADENNNPVMIFDKKQISVRPNSKPPFSIEEFYLEYNTSTDELTRRDLRDMVAYIRNFAVLRDPPSDISFLLVKPTAGAIPGPSPAPTPSPPPTGTPLPGDLNLDHVINSLDWSIMNSKWYTNDSNSDLNKDGQVNSLDYARMSSNWGKTW